MLAICIECSHKRGMGHLFRALNLISLLEKKGQPYVLLMNDDDAGKNIVRQHEISPIIVDLSDCLSNWEAKLIRERRINVWLNDRLDTGAETARHVKDAGIPLYTIDDMGEGAAFADGNFANLIFEDIEKVPGKTVYAGCDYLILNPDIKVYRNRRVGLSNILVTLGGSDTYGVTVRVVVFLKRWKKEKRNIHKQITVLLGPGSVIRTEVEAEIEGTDFSLVSSVPSLPAFFARFDLAVTGGGVTCLEAAASGLPCLIIANEPHEIQIGQYMERSGSAVFAGYYKEMDLGRIDEIRDIGAMSARGMETVGLSGAERVLAVMNAEEQEFSACREI